MIEGPVGGMVERSQARQGFNAPPKLMDVRPMALEHPEASIVVLICSDPRLNPSEILSLHGIAGKGLLSWRLAPTEANTNRPYGLSGPSPRRSSG